jgi:hypothetical protein
VERSEEKREKWREVEMCERKMERSEREEQEDTKASLFIGSTTDT